MLGSLQSWMGRALSRAQGLLNAAFHVDSTITGQGREVTASPACTASLPGNTTDLAARGTKLVPEQTLHKISAVSPHKKPAQAPDRALCQAQYDTSTFSPTT